MSLLLGQSGSLLREDYVQACGPSGILSKGAYLQPGKVASMGADDPSRFRNTAYVPPRQIELMHGFMDYQFQNGNPLQADPTVVPYATFVTQAPRAGYAYQGPTSMSGPYGAVMSTTLAPARCPAESGCYINPAGGCLCGAQSPYYDASSMNVYY